MVESFRLGHHLNLKDGIDESFKYLDESKANFIQIFINSPKSFMVKKDKTYLDLIKKNVDERKLKIVVHGNYMLNFCNPSESKIYKNAVRILKDELNDSVRINSIGVVIHMGKNVKKLNLTDQEAEDNFIKGLEEVLDNTDKKSVLILETGAGQGTEINTEIDALGRLKKRLSKYGDRVKFCIDTCHIFSAGYNISNVKYISEFEKIVEKFLGWNNIAVIHFNDSKVELGCKKDRHEDIGKGYIKLEGLIKFIKLAKKYNIPTVLETPCDYISHKEQLELLRKHLN